MPILTRWSPPNQQPAGRTVSGGREPAARRTCAGPLGAVCRRRRHPRATRRQRTRQRPDPRLRHARRTDHGSDRAMTSTRRPLTIDDPLAAANACHVARSAGASGADRLWDLGLIRSARTRAAAATVRRGFARRPRRLDPRARRTATGHRQTERTRGVPADRRRAPLARLANRRSADASGTH